MADKINIVTRVNSANVLDEGLRIGGKGRQMNSKVKVSQTRCDYACIENKRGTQYRGRSQGSGWVQYKLQCPYTISSRISTMSMTGPSSGLRSTKITGSISYILVSSPRDSTRIVDSG
jgi:hypothetical protein